MQKFLPQGLISISAFVCERVLREVDGVVSAIRMVDLFHVPPQSPPVINPSDGSETITLSPVRFEVLVILKAEPGYSVSHRVAIKLQDPTGSIVRVSRDDLEVATSSRFGPEVAGGATVNAQLTFDVKEYGLYLLLVELDGELVHRSPITLLRGAAPENTD